MNCKSSSFRLIIVSLILFAQLFSANKCNAQNHDTASVYIYNLTNAINVLKDDFNFRTSVYSVVGTSLEPYFYLNFDSLIILHEQKHGVNLNFRITRIIDSLNHDSIVISDTYLTDLLTYFKSRRDFLNLTVPNYITFFNDSLNKIIPKILYDDFRDNTSFPCFNCNDEFFEIENCKSTLAWLITNTIKDIAIIHPPYTLSKWIINCISNKNSLNPCNFCPTTPPPAGNLPQLTNNVNNWELGIRNRNTDLNNFPYPTNGNDNCLIVYNNPSTNPPNNPGAYAILKSRLDIADAYKIVRYNCGIPNPSDHSEKAVKITTFPIIDFQNTGFAPNFTERSGNYMTLCENLINPFVNYTENDINTGCGNTIFNWRFAAAYGVYQITRPTGGSVSLPPLYFSYPYSNGIWWGNNSPDITVLFDHEQGVEPCTNPIIDHIAKRYGVDGCSMCSSAGLALGMPNQTAKDYLVNDDQNVILNYWSTPKIQIGLKNGPSTLAWSANGNTYEFLPTLTPYQCNNWNPTILLSTLSLLPGNEYEVLKPIDVNGTLYPANSLFYIEIKVKFENGLEIDRKECITVPIPTSYTTVQLFSRVKNFDSNITNYQIKVYQ